MIHNMSMADSYLSYANDELERALNALEKYINVNNNALFNQAISGQENTIANQRYSINKYIIPAIQTEIINNG